MRRAALLLYALALGSTATSPIATEAACNAVGGQFRPRLFGWMVHVMAFSGGDDPWNAHHH